jgi:ferredoxin
MISLDDETCIDRGICAEVLPQFFEVAEGEVRVRRGEDSDDGEVERGALGDVVRNPSPDSSGI